MSGDHSSTSNIPFSLLLCSSHKYLCARVLSLGPGIWCSRYLTHFFTPVIIQSSSSSPWLPGLKTKQNKQTNKKHPQLLILYLSFCFSWFYSLSITWNYITVLLIHYYHLSIYFFWYEFYEVRNFICFVNSCIPGVKKVPGYRRD